MGAQKNPMLSFPQNSLSFVFQNPDFNQDYIIFQIAKYQIAYFYLVLSLRKLEEVS